MKKQNAKLQSWTEWNGTANPHSPKYHLPLIVLSIHVFSNSQQRGQLGFPVCSWGEREIAYSKSASCELCTSISRTPSNSVAGMAGDKGDSTLFWVWQPFIASILGKFKLSSSLYLKEWYLLKCDKHYWSSPLRHKLFLAHVRGTKAKNRSAYHPPSDSL